MGPGNDTYVVDNPGDVVTEIASVAFTPPAGWTIKGTADFNNDGQTDVLVSNGTLNQVWYLNNGVVSSTVAMSSNSGAWTLIGIGDFNGDGNKDLLWQNGGLQYVHYLNGRDADRRRLCLGADGGCAAAADGRQPGDGYGPVVDQLHAAERG